MGVFVKIGIQPAITMKEIPIPQLPCTISYTIGVRHCIKPNLEGKKFLLFSFSS